MQILGFYSKWFCLLDIFIRVALSKVWHRIWHSCSYLYEIICRAHSFPWKILPNSADQLVKFHSGEPRQNRPNSTACHGIPFMAENWDSCSETSVIEAVIVLSYVSNIKKVIFFFSKVQWDSWLMTWVDWNEWLMSQSSLIMPMIILIPDNFSNPAKFRRNVKIPQQRANSAARLEIPWPCGP